LAGVFHCGARGSLIAQKRVDFMLILLAVALVILLVMVVTIAYALVLRELRDLRSTLGTIVNGEPVGDHFRRDEAPLRAGENEVIAGGVDSPFVFSVFIA
jgi:hypothetical protein